MFSAKLVSSLEKPMIKTDIRNYPELKKLSALRGETVSLQVFYSVIDEKGFYEGQGWPLVLFGIEFGGDLAPLASLRRVKDMPAEMPVVEHSYDDNYLSIEPGLYPDLLLPMGYHGKEHAILNQLHSLWIEIPVPADMKAGDHTLTVKLTPEGRDEINLAFTLHVIAAVLPEQTLTVTQWFHCDCLARYYHLKAFSDEHFAVIESFMRCAVRNGINLILTPVFTPPLDTEIGGERPTMQLVGVTVKNGKYSFNFRLLDRWIDMCDRCGVKYLEIAHFFTQWGAAHAPKIMATVDGEYKRIFGWETDAHGEEYVTFLRTFLKRFLTHMKKRGDDKRCFFHISDEPYINDLESYRQAKASVADILEGYTIMDALSNFEYYKEGISTTPVVATNHIQPFLDAKAKNLWAYYCCGQVMGVSNRLVAMPSYRNRFMGIQMFYYDIVGFLQWGFNFYESRFSVHHLNPYIDMSGDRWVPSGDTYSVLPDEDGNPLETLRIRVFAEGLQDVRAMQLAAKLCGADKVKEAIVKAYGKEIRFDECARTADEVLRVREVVNKMIEEKV